MIDWHKVRELRDEVGTEDFGEVVELFIDEVEEVISQLGAGGRSLEHDLHFLKGSALNLGFTQFSEACKAGETACVNGADASVDTGEVLGCYQASKSMFLQGLEQELAA